MLDAGAGTGVLQWYLAQQGAAVISVDRMSRALVATAVSQAIPGRWNAKRRPAARKPGFLGWFSQGVERDCSKRWIEAFYHAVP